jgi:hypothetical protein
MRLSLRRWLLTKRNPKLKAEFEKQAAAYRKLAVERARRYKLDLPPQSN